MALSKVQAAGLTADLIDETKLADNSIDSEHYNDGSIDNAHLADDAVGVDELSATGTAGNTTYLRGDNTWTVPPDTNTTYSVQDGQLSQNNFTDADHTKLNGIAASANAYVHPNHSGEVTSTADGATVIASDVVDEDNLKVSNSPTNGYFLSAQSGNTGGLTWAEAGGGVSSDAQNNTKAGDAAGNALDGDTLGNTLFGENAGTAINSGDYNNCFGFESGKSITSGNYNISVGFESLKTATTGSGNIALGHKAMNGGDITGGNNIAIGYEAGKSFAGNINGNVAVGYRALYTQSGDKYNTAIGYEAGKDIGSAHDIVAVGHKACQSLTTGAYNTAVGYQAAQNLEGGARNVAVGREAMALNVSGNDNTCVGIEAGRAITAGENTCVGRYAGRTNTTGSKNVYIGAHCADAGTNGQYNVAIGTYAFSSADGSSEVGSNVTMVGYGAGYACYGGGNTLIGQQAAGNSLQSGTNNVCIGKEAAYSQLDNDGSNQLYIARGNVAAGSGSCWVYGNGDGDVIRAGNGTAWSTTSDERIKKNIVDNNVGLSVINNVRVRNFEYRTEAEIDRTAFGGKADDPKWTAEEAAEHDDAVEGEYLKGYGIDKPGIQLGVIAQELEAVAPRCVKTDSTSKKTVDSTELTWHMVNAIKELSAKVAALEAG